MAVLAERGTRRAPRAAATPRYRSRPVAGERVRERRRPCAAVTRRTLHLLVAAAGAAALLAVTTRSTERPPATAVTTSAATTASAAPSTSSAVLSPSSVAPTSAAPGRDPRLAVGGTAPAFALVHHYREDSPFPADTATRAVVVANAWHETELRALAPASPRPLLLAYKNVWAATTLPETRGRYATGLTAAAVDARPDWQLRDAKGAWLTFRDYPWLRQADAGNADYQRAWAAAVVAELRGGGFDGVFLDDLLTAADAHHPGVRSPRYGDDAALQTATRSFLAAVVPALHDAGLLAVGNIPAAYDHPGLWDDWLGLLDGALEENFVHYGTGEYVGDAGGRWERHVDEVASAARLGKVVVVRTDSNDAGGDATRYGYASYLLGNDGDASFAFGDSVAPPADAAIDLGRPLGPRVRLDSGVWRRDFERGVVLVNPTSRARDVSLGDRFVSGRTTVDAIRLDATRAVVLARA